jgi:arylsulfatase A-like enzyme
MKLLTYHFSILVFTVISFSGLAKKQNVILFLIDDLGWSDLSLTGSKFYETPNIDHLASEGVFFSDAYATSPLCSPTRASILTGKYPSRIKMTYISGTSGPKGPGYPLIAPNSTGNINPKDVTLAEALRSHGYKTVHIGKWHLQNHTDRGKTHYPEKHGFDLNIAGFRMGQPGSYYFPFKSERHPSTNVPGLENGKNGDYLTDSLTDRAIEFISEYKDRPFFINFWYYTVHTPIQPKKEKLQKYVDKVNRMGLSQKHKDGIAVWESISRKHQSSPAYACMVESMDENIGRLLKSLRKQNLENDTLIIFFSDNGGLSTGSGPNAPTSCSPLRAGKGWLYEGGIRVPLIIKMPGKIKEGLKIEEPVLSTDLYPTILDLLDLPLMPTQHKDGKSLKPILNEHKKKTGREAIYFHYPHYHHINSMGPSGAIRIGKYKLIEVFESGKTELYNLENDPGELNDLSEKKPLITEMLLEKLKSWQNKSGADMATLNPNYNQQKDFRKR